MTLIINEIETAVKEIITGNVIGLPTETVYGLGANALNDNAVLKIFEAKERPRFNPLIVHVHDFSEFEKYAGEIPEDLHLLYEKFSPGPLTYILKKKKNIPDIVTAGNDTIALRVPSHEMFREVIRRAQVPVAAPSANTSGRISPTSAEDVLKELDGKINYILDGGRSDIGIESTVIDLSGEGISILRHGFITKEEIESLLGKKLKTGHDKILSPGMSKSHYAPLTPLYELEKNADLNKFKKENKNAGILDLARYSSLKEAALNLYSDLRKLDSMKHEFLVYRKVTDKGLGAAINDRLHRASSGVFKIKSNQD